MSKPIVVACSMDVSFGGSSTPSPWHTDAVGGRPPHHLRTHRLDGVGAAHIAAPRSRTVGRRGNRHILYLSGRTFSPRRRGLLGSFGPFGICGGILLGSAVGAAVTMTLDRAAVDAWGWRIPFLLGIAVG